MSGYNFSVLKEMEKHFLDLWLHNCGSCFNRIIDSVRFIAIRYIVSEYSYCSKRDFILERLP